MNQASSPGRGGGEARGPGRLRHQPPHHTRHQGKETERFHRVTRAALDARYRLNLDKFWLDDGGLIDLDNLRPTDEVAAEIVENLALEQFRKVALELAKVTEGRRARPTRSSCCCGPRRSQFQGWADACCNTAHQLQLVHA